MFKKILLGGSLSALSIGTLVRSPLFVAHPNATLASSLFVSWFLTNIIPPLSDASFHDKLLGHVIGTFVPMQIAYWLQENSTFSPLHAVELGFGLTAATCLGITRLLDYLNQEPVENLDQGQAEIQGPQQSRIVILRLR